jgi:hypothetical protein
MVRLACLLAAIAGMALSVCAAADDRVYERPADFVASVFPSTAPQVRTLWLTAAVGDQAARILGHPPTQLRQQYWSDGKKTAWILEEIGKEDPITAGFVVANGGIEQVRVLIYRESRGSEIRLPGFLAQFNNATLTDNHRLDRSIDGISGATLSVNAMVRMSQLALLFAHAAASR